MRFKIQAVCALLLIMTSVHAREQLTTLRGEAYDLNGDSLLYTSTIGSSMPTANRPPHEWNIAPLMVTFSVAKPWTSAAV